MDVNALPISPEDLYARQGTAKAPLLIDVRRREAFDSGQLLIIGAARRLPDDVSKWRNALPAGRPMVAYCVHGHEVSQSVASTLRGVGMTASYLEGGIAAWQERKLPTRLKRDAREQVGHSRASQDRPHRLSLAGEPLRRSRSRIHLRSRRRSSKVAADVGGTPYDIDDVKFGHVGDQCSFDAIVRPTVSGTPRSIARNHRTRRRHLAAGARAAMRRVARGLVWPVGNFPDDHDMLKHGMVMYDALYTWCRMKLKAGYEFPPASAY